MPKKASPKRKKVRAKKIKLTTEFFNLLFGFALVGIGAMYFAFSNPKTECANSISCIDNITTAYDNSASAGEFMNTVVSAPPEVQDRQFRDNVLGETTAQKKIFIDLTNQRLLAMEGNNLVYNFKISSGKYGWTPTGDFKIWYKVKYTRMSGGSKAKGTYYNLPNVPFTMFFYNDEIPKSRGYGIHGAYWHDNFGQPMSHGCINLQPEDAETLYYWADPAPYKNAFMITDQDVSTPITIFGKYEG